MKKITTILLFLPLFMMSQHTIELSPNVEKGWRQYIAEDLLQGYNSEFKFGQNSAVGTTEEVIWDGGGNYVFLSSAETMDIVSTDADDSLGGTGAQTMIIYGLNANWIETYQVIVLDGTTIVTTDTAFLRVFRAVILTSGTSSPIGNANEGTITVTSHTTTTLQAQIGVGNGQTLMCVYTVPAGKTAYITGISFGVGQGKECTFIGKFRNGVGGAFSVKFSLTLYQNTYFGSLEIPLRIPEKIDIVVTGVTLSGTVKANASFGIILKDN